MRFATARAALVVTAMLAPLALISFACRTTDQSARLKDDETPPPPGATAGDPVADAKKILSIIGGTEGSRNLCAAACHGQGDGDGAGNASAWHTVTENLVMKWGNNLHRTLDCMAKAAPTEGAANAEQSLAEAKIKCMKAGANFSGPRLGFMRGALHHAEFQTLFQQAYGDQWQTEYKKLELKAMPNEANLEKFSEADYAAIKDWVKKYRPEDAEAFWPGLRVALGGSEGAAPCTESTVSDDFKQYIEKLAADKQGWHHEHVKNGLKMFGCPAPKANHDLDKDPLTCFEQKKGTTGEDLFPLHSAVPAATTWLTKEAADLGAKARILRQLPYKSTYWVRSSADGRFVGFGVGSPGDSPIPEDFPLDTDSGLGAIEDLVLEGRPRAWVNAAYDPGFFPDNKGFTFHGVAGSTEEEGPDASGGAVFCNQSLLADPSKTVFELHKEKTFCRSSSMGVYQHVGANLDGSSYFVIRSDDYQNDDGANSETRDPTIEPFLKDDAVLEIWPMVADEKRYKAEAQPVQLKIPFEGDWTVSSTARLTSSRLAGLTNHRPAQQGYKIRQITGSGTALGLKEMATVCLKGGKASFSFDERTLAVHHYVEKEDAAELGYADANAAEFAPLVRNSSNVYVYDFLKKQKVRVTNMKAGQFALYPHFRADGWLYFVVRDNNTDGKEYLVASDAAIRLRIAR